MAGSEAPALRKLPGTATPIRLPLPRQLPTLPFSATDPLMCGAWTAVPFKRSKARVCCILDGVSGTAKPPTAGAGGLSNT